MQNKLNNYFFSNATSYKMSALDSASCCLYPNLISCLTNGYSLSCLTARHLGESLMYFPSTNSGKFLHVLDRFLLLWIVHLKFFNAGHGSSFPPKNNEYLPLSNFFNIGVFSNSFCLPCVTSLISFSVRTR